MFYDVKILNASGQIKKVISARELSKMHWHAFQVSEENIGPGSRKTSKVPGWVKKKLDLQFSGFKNSSASV